MKYLLKENQADIIVAFNLFDVYFNSISRHFDDLLNIDNIYFDKMVDRIYTSGLQLKKKPNLQIPRHIFLDLNPCISNSPVSTKINDKFWTILLYVLPCVILFLCLSVLLALR